MGALPAIGFVHVSFSRRIRNEDSIPAGPSTVEAMHDWCAHYMDRALLHKVCDLEWMRSVEVLLTVKWAGLGGMAVGWRYLQRELQQRSKRGEEVPQLRMRLASFTDYDETCQGIKSLEKSKAKQHTTNEVTRN